MLRASWSPERSLFPTGSSLAVGAVWCWWVPVGLAPVLPVGLPLLAGIGSQLNHFTLRLLFLIASALVLVGATGVMLTYPIQ